MPKDIWYEVYVSDSEGSRTLENGICATYEEAKKFKASVALPQEHIHIDKWTNKENPTRLNGLE
jgi:hypothetical protein